MMLSKVLLGLVLNCAPATHSSFDGSWTPEDQATQASAVSGCQKRYPKTSPCLRHIRKTEPQVYRVTCGAQELK